MTSRVLGVLLLVSAVGYTVYVWWGVISNMEFLEFTAAIVLFFVTIPLSPIYVGVQGNWEPTITIAIEVFVAFILFNFASKCDEF